MPNYYVDEAVFALPERHFVDRTIHSLESPLAGKDPLSVTIRRVPLAEGKTLQELVDQEVSGSTARATSFTVLEQAEVALGGSPAIVLRVRWRTGDVAYHQRQAHVGFNGTWIALAVTSPYADRAACDEAFDRIVNSLTWRNS